MTDYEPEHHVPLVKDTFQSEYEHFTPHDDDIFPKKSKKHIPDEMEIQPLVLKALASFLDLVVFTILVVLFIAFSVFKDSKSEDTDDDKSRHVAGVLIIGILLIHAIQSAVHIYHARSASIGPSGVRLKFDMSWSRLATSLLYSILMIPTALMVYDAHCFYMVSLFLLAPIGTCISIRQLLIINIRCITLEGFKSPVRTIATATDTLLLLMAIPLAIMVSFADDSCSKF
mmetsp:Transcript_10480/g.14352  ORF Transcript_10480/g.14352 Transcript_10480/m.14352 type:complete len:229 (-) Transcript_10480:30-716(-)